MTETAQVIDIPASAPITPAKRVYAVAEAGKQYRFTVENARLMSARAWELRRKRQKEREAENNGKAVEAVAQPEPSQTAIGSRVRTMERLIGQTVAAFKIAEEPRDMQALAMALDRLYGTWSLLTGHERPGVRRPQKATKSPMDYSHGLPTPDA